MCFEALSSGPLSSFLFKWWWGVQNGPVAGERRAQCLGFENKIYIIIFSRTARFGCLKFGVLHWPSLIYQVYSGPP